MLEIEIGGEKLELPQDAKAVFNFDFFDIEDFTKAGASYSYTITVPYTETNDRIFKFARRLDNFDNVQSFSAIVRIWGVEIDSSARCKITGCSTKGYNINLLLNISDLSSQIADKTLQNLTTLGSVLYSYANQNYTNPAANFVNFVGGRVMDKNNDSPYLLGQHNEAWWRNFFSAKMLHLFEKIFAETTYTLDTNYPASFQNLENLYIHFTNEKSDVEEAHELERVNRFVELTLKADLPVVNAILTSSLFSKSGAGSIYTNADIAFPIQFLYYETDSSLTYSINLQLEKTGLDGVIFEIGYASDVTNVNGTFVALRKVNILEPNIYNIGFTLSGNVINNRLYFRTIRNSVSDPNTIIKAGFRITIEPTNYIPQNRYVWDYAKNLPPIPQKDLVKTMLLFSGCVLSIDTFLKKVKVLAIKDIAQNPAIDITEHVDFSESAEIEFVPPKIAQKNTYKFKNTLDGSFTYLINNSDLPEKREISTIFARYENELFYERYAIFGIRKTKTGRAFNNTASSFDGGLREHSQRHAVEIETEYKAVDAFFGRNDKTMYHPDFGANLFVIYTIHGNAPGINYTIYNAVNLSNNVVRGQQCLANIQDVLNLDYADTIYKNFKKVKLKAVLPLTFLLKASISTPVFIGANINQTFLLSAIRNWTSPHSLCEIELIRLNLNP